MPLHLRMWTQKLDWNWPRIIARQNQPCFDRPCDLMGETFRVVSQRRCFALAMTLPEILHVQRRASGPAALTAATPTLVPCLEQFAGDRRRTARHRESLMPRTGNLLRPPVASRCVSRSRSFNRSARSANALADAIRSAFCVSRTLIRRSSCWTCERVASGSCLPHRGQASSFGSELCAYMKIDPFY